MTRTLHFPLVLVGSLGLSLFVGCGDKDDDDTGDGTTGASEICDDGEDNDGDGDVDCDDSDCDDEDNCVESDCDDGEDNDGDGDVDCDDDDCEDEDECEVFVPDFMLMSGSGGLKDGAQFDVTYGGAPLGHYFELTLIDSENWSGPDDTRNYCTVLWDTTGADVASACDGCWNGAAWTVDTSMVLGTDGECDKLDPDDWSDDVASYLSGFGFGYGFGPLSTDFRSTLQDTYKADWAEYGDYFLAQYVQTDLAGADWYELNWAFAFEYDPTTGELVDGGASIIDMTGADAFAPDGYYQGRWYYGFSL